MLKDPKLMLMTFIIICGCELLHIRMMRKIRELNILLCKETDKFLGCR